MQYIMVPTWLMIVLIILAWAMLVYLFWFKPKVLPKLDNYFAYRRHIRRNRNRAEADRVVTNLLITSRQEPYLRRTKSAKVVDVNTTQIGGIPYHATARHRR